MSRRLSACILLLMGARCLQGAESLNLELVRTTNGADCTIGDLGVNGSNAGIVTLELPWKDNQGSISRIPAGTYGTVLRYDHADGWRLELTNVIGRTRIQIHIGNWPKDTEGCILVGSGRRGGCEVQKSGDAYRALKRLCYGTDNPTATPNKTVTLKIEDPKPLQP